MTVRSVGTGPALVLALHPRYLQPTEDHHLKCAAPHNRWENTSATDGYVDDLQPSECKTHAAAAACVVLASDSKTAGAQRSAQRTANAWCHPEQPQLPKIRCQLAKGMYAKQGTVIVQNSSWSIAERSETL